MLPDSDPSRSVLIYHPLSFSLPFIDISHRRERPLASLDTEYAHVGAVGAGCHRDAAHDDNDIDQSGRHGVFNIRLTAMEDLRVIGTAEDALDEDERAAKRHAVHLKDSK